jgi:hypothetical protein
LRKIRTRSPSYLRAVEIIVSGSNRVPPLTAARNAVKSSMTLGTAMQDRAVRVGKPLISVPVAAEALEVSFEHN